MGGVRGVGGVWVQHSGLQLEELDHVMFLDLLTFLVKNTRILICHKYSFHGQTLFKFYPISTSKVPYNL